MVLSTVILDKKEGNSITGDKMDTSTAILNTNEEELNVDNVKKQTVMSDKNEKMECPLLKCTVCGESYSEDRIPRNLICGHSLCTICANKCLQTKKLCFECCEKQLEISGSDLPVNYPLLRLIRSVISKEVNLKDITVPQFAPPISITDTYKDAGKCPAHGCPMLFMCVTCSMWVCQDCLIVDHPYLPRGSCRVVGLTEAFDAIRKEHEKYANLFHKDIQHVKKNLEPNIAKHKFCLKHCSCNIRSHTRLTQTIETDIKELGEKDDSTVDSALEFVKQSQEAINRATSPEELTPPCKDLLDRQAELKAYIALENTRKTSLLNNISMHFFMELKLLMKGEEPIYAVLEEEKGTRWAAITYKDNRRLLSSLRDGQPPSEGITIPYEFVWDLIPKDNATIFFEVGSADELKGRVYVRLFGNNPRTCQAILLCSGEKGPSYRNTCFYEYDQRNGILKGGDYENNNGTGGQSIINICAAYAGYGHQRCTGLLVGDNYFTAKFHFYLKDIKGNAHTVLGKVHGPGGLDILKATSKLEPITNSIIRECGLCIPREQR